MSGTDLPAPLVRADVDLSGFDGFLLDVQRLFASELWALSSGDEFKAAVALWGRAWQQTPPGSLPNDERVLSAFSGAGKNWKKVRAMALRGFIECSDGRLYHKVLCDDVLRAHRKQQAFRDRTKNATEARRQRNERRDDERNDDRHEARDDERNVAEDADVTSVQGQGQGQEQEQIVRVSRAEARDDTHPAAAGDPPKPRRRGRPPSQETLWPDDLAMGPADRDYAAKHGFAGVAGARLFEKFEAKAKAKGWTYKDWRAAFRTFVLNEHPPPARPNGSQAWRPPDV